MSDEKREGEVERTLEAVADWLEANSGAEVHEDRAHYVEQAGEVYRICATQLRRDRDELAAMLLREHESASLDHPRACRGNDPGCDVCALLARVRGSR